MFKINCEKGCQTPEIQSTSDVKNVLKKHKIGDTVKMVVERDSKKITVEITLQAQTQTN